MYKIYGKPGCGNCIAAKELLTRNNQSFVEYTLGIDYTVEVLLEMVPSAKTVPQIFYNDQYVGGYSQLIERLKYNDTSSTFIQE
jgi:glutaredoxin